MVVGGSRAPLETSGKAWFEVLDEAQQEAADGPPPRSEVDGRAHYESEVDSWAAARAARATGDDRYMDQMVAGGTLSDKVAAMTLLVQESPVHRLKTLEGLIGLAKSGTHASKMAIEALKELFGGDELLPADRKLREYEGVLQKYSSSKVAALRHFESELRRSYGAVVDLVEGYTKHQASELRSFAVETAAFLLSRKPELEARLLSIVVNKLGDPDGKVATAASRGLSKLLDQHRAMTRIVCDEVMGFAARPNLDARALRNAIAFLGQVVLSKELHQVAEGLVETYAALFASQVAAAGGRRHLKTKLLSGLLTGLNRALPYVDAASLDKMATSEQQQQQQPKKGGRRAGGGDDDSSPVDAIFLASHSATFAARVQALSLLERLSARSPETLRPRFYRALYALMHSDEARRATKPTLFLNLCYKALRSPDLEPPRFAACLKRLAQLGAHSTPAVAAALVYLLSAVGRRDALLDDPHHNALEQQQQQQPSWRDAAVKREPLYAAGPGSRLWELALFQSHYHPSVRKFAEATLAGGGKGHHLAHYRGDPLDDFALSNFLDRFAYRNPKARPGNPRHAKPPPKPTLDTSFDHADFYTKYLDQAAAHKLALEDRAAAAAAAAQRLAAARTQGSDDDDDDDAFDGDSSLDDDDDDQDDDDDDDHAAVDDDDDDDDDDDFDEDEEDASKPTPAVEARGAGSKKRKSPFVDADEYFEEEQRRNEERATKKKKKRR